ncbi:PREDICTED: gastrokine-3-like [Chrysochloris asiatica]|uniref:Gastrokine-3 n=1 Tax=Chrysochloris asiatica TaxID=185453 RepID=A0A9B0TK27_CHRAS|nr:PREDICTED: gastrokine-3-like [Chrysochloris asiatica]
MGMVLSESLKTIYLKFSLFLSFSYGFRKLFSTTPTVSQELFWNYKVETNTSDSHLLDGSFGTQTIHVNALRGMVSIRDNNVLSEWDGSMNYKNGLLAAKLFDKMACVLVKMDQAVFPTLDEIIRALGQQDSKQYPSTRGLTYTVLPSRVKNVAQYGMPIKDMCRAVPTYFAHQQKEGGALAVDPDSCFEIQLLSFMGLAICGEIPGL